MYLYRNGNEVGYWRKANHIHAWFVENVQGGKDDCAEYPVSVEQLTKLLTTCTQVVAGCELVSGNVYNGTTWAPGKAPVRIYEAGKIIADPSKAIELLPTTNGFFFGNTDYDEYYLDKTKATIKIIEELLVVHKPTNIYSYQSSW